MQVINHKVMQVASFFSTQLDSNMQHTVLISPGHWQHRAGLKKTPLSSGLTAGVQWWMKTVWDRQMVFPSSSRYFQFPSDTAGCVTATASGSSKKSRATYSERFSSGTSGRRSRGTSRPRFPWKMVVLKNGWNDLNDLYAVWCVFVQGVAFWGCTDCICIAMAICRNLQQHINKVTICNKILIRNNILRTFCGGFWLSVSRITETLATLHTNFQTDLHAIFREGWPMNKLLNFGGDPDHWSISWQW